ncbi:hypothetical protein BKA67DRAFT_549150 [Truncatella angustata]|uniref:Uncharacterized protein n=1 Tax=Truncatella angustata TaxID=152316 RepID=A0A9P9A5F4_9PEZI|nr:uncharacterized protein BKA67DRAFT_549150 [Truncatella angustata]KAH6660784.1 hypothetical protein BKA67DRAFT_549150 [Truncatella angustata]
MAPFLVAFLSYDRRPSLAALDTAACYSFCCIANRHVQWAPACFIQTAAPACHISLPWGVLVLETTRRGGQGSLTKP